MSCGGKILTLVILGKTTKNKTKMQKQHQQNNSNNNNNNKTKASKKIKCWCPLKTFNPFGIWLNPPPHKSGFDFSNVLMYDQELS